MPKQSLKNATQPKLFWEDNFIVWSAALNLESLKFDCLDNLTMPKKGRIDEKLKRKRIEI